MPDPNQPATVLFVCQHGAGKSRMAAAWFNAAPPPGWRASTAGVEPQTAVSLHAPRLLAGTAAEAALDHAVPRPVSAVPSPALTISIDCAVPGAARWDLEHDQFEIAMAEEILQRVRQLADTLRDGSGG